jgi:methylated-DNA-[protein]-cysteine S-methyltransferase
MRNYAKTGGKAGLPGYRTPSSFRGKVFEIVRKIPKGKTMTYKQVAGRAGRPCAYRAVGNILNKNYDPRIPCHRVIRSDGSPGGYNRGTVQKEKKLKNEGAISI